MEILVGAGKLGKARCARLKSHRGEGRAQGRRRRQPQLPAGRLPWCLAECLGTPLLADTLRDPPARTTLIAMLYQSTARECSPAKTIVQIVAALERGDHAAAEALMAERIGTVQSALRVRGAHRSARAAARCAGAAEQNTRLAPEQAPQAAARAFPRRPRFFDLPRSPAAGFLCIQAPRLASRSLPSPSHGLRSRRAHAQNALDNVLKAKTIKIAVPTDYPPYGSVRQRTLKPQGLRRGDGRTRRHQLGVKVELVPVTSANRIPYLQTARQTS